MCPQPPLLIPQLAQNAAGELDQLRAACTVAMARLLTADPDVVVVVGSGPDDGRYGPADYGNFGRYGGPSLWVNLGNQTCPGADGLPLSILIGAWLLQQAGTSIPRYGRGVPATAPAEQCREIGVELREAPESVGLLVMGDGSARRTEKAPGHFDPRAEAFDGAVAEALATADGEALARLDPVLSGELMVAGRAPWQVLAGAVADHRWRGELLHHDAPYGVGYLVASWMPA